MTQQSSSGQFRKFQQSDFSNKTYLGYGRCGKTFRCDFQGYDLALKVTDLSKKKGLLPELMQELEVYCILEDIQGIFIPKLVCYSYLLSTAYFAI